MNADDFGEMSISKKNRCIAFCFLFSFQSATSSEIHEISFSLIFKEIMWWEMFDALFLKDWILISKNHSPAPHPVPSSLSPKIAIFQMTPIDVGHRSIRSTYCIKDSYRYDGTLHTDLWKSKTIREIEKNPFSIIWTYWNVVLIFKIRRVQFKWCKMIFWFLYWFQISKDQFGVLGPYL